ncbi:MAG: hypothetical protein WBB28_24815 [Crinalium sp.]
MSNITEGKKAFFAQNYKTALSLLLPLAHKGNAEAQCLIGCMYQLGLGVEVDSLEAAKWYKKSSLQGYGVASNNLAGMLLAGSENIAPSQVEADKLFYLAREQGFVHAPLSSDYL